MARQPAPIGVPTPTCSELARCVRRPPRVATRRRPATCAELACWLRRPHRVTIAVPTRGSALSSSHYRGANPSSSHYRGSTSSSCRNRGSNRVFSRLGWSAQPTLLSLSWYKPWVQQTGLVCRTHTPVAIVGQTPGRRPPRVAIAGSNRGE